MFDILKIIGFAKEAYKIQQDIYDKLKNKEVVGVSGGGMVKIKINGQFEIISILIDQNLYYMKDVFFLQDMVLSAFNDAIKNVKLEIAEEIKIFVNKLIL